MDPKKFLSDKYTNHNPITDENTIFLYDLGCINENQLRKYIDDYVAGYRVITNKRVYGDWRVNHICDRKGNPTGIAYVYFSNSQLYHIFIGNNPDGSKRSSRVPNPYFKGKNSINNNNLKHIDLNTPEYIDIPNEVLVKYPVIKLNPIHCINSDIKHIVKPKINPCVIRDVKSDLERNILICNRAPNYIDRQYIKDIFSFYVKDKRHLDNGYPKIYIHSSGKSCTIEVTYHPESYDGLFAIRMTKKISVNVKGKIYTLMFDHKKKIFS